MKPQLLKINSSVVQSFTYRHDREPQNHNKWHYHEELEFIYFKTGSGTQFIGDHIAPFSSGDMVLVGSNLSHYWLFDQQYVQSPHMELADIHVLHFKAQFLGDYFMQLPENTALKDLFVKAKRGLLIQESVKEKLIDLINQVEQSSGTARIIQLLSILEELCKPEAFSVLSSAEYAAQNHISDDLRMAECIDFISKNFTKQIKLWELAERAKMTENSFCRYFKKNTGKTLMQFIIEIRIGHACKLLLENELNMKQICFESGFQNLVSFHKYFKQQMGSTPLAYQKAYLQKKVLAS